ncbi:hypothetical protein [Labilibaculum antarcticum]|uniref:Uncharacterized protein n=1 Tax=Labilibaculum antarcticum TaxID=1717717 RepID=A0A1Y1CQ22_9BACT|nr:hypothetical protein [Labilibaculum antarcticum]BAX82042.1 hypothetical protein ALGA_3750 [Labilibaculum antarcticum]
MKGNIYIKALEIGFENQTTGISFSKVVEELGIEKDLESPVFACNFTIWFYTNFYNPDAEASVKYNSTGPPYITPVTLDELKEFKTEKSFIKGEATQKYIDYLELKEARESSQIAKMFAYASIFIAICSIIVSPIVSNYLSESPTPVIVTENRDNSNDLIYQKLTEIDSTINQVVKDFNQTKLKQLVVTAPKK